jgi:predicted glycosyltransferase
MIKKRILYCILNWGLGHATRSIPIIRALIEHGHQVILVSTGRSIALLRTEFPGCEWVDLPDYGVTYSRDPRMLIPHLLLQTPRIFYRLYSEHAGIRKIVRQKEIDLIISDNRYGCYSRHVPSYFMIHQLRFQLPHGLRWSAFVSELFNRVYFRHYQAIFVPDMQGAMNLTGALSHSGRIAGHPKLRYTGLFSSLNITDPAPREDIDYLFLVSGPEPSRTVFENMIFDQAERIPGRKVAILGKPESPADSSGQSDSPLEHRPHLNRLELGKMILRARMVICRSGYSTMMELATLGKPAILIPTPGQTEQEYLARHAMERGLFFSVPQSGMDLLKTIQEANEFFREPQIRFPANQIHKIFDVLKLEYCRTKRRASR